MQQPGVPGSKALLKRFVRAGNARGRSGGWVTRKLSHHGPVVVSGQWVAGASFLGRKRALLRGPGRGVQAAQGIQRGCPSCTRTPPSSKLVPPQSLTKATFWSGQQTSQLGQYFGAQGVGGLSVPHTGGPEFTGLYRGCSGSDSGIQGGHSLGSKSHFVTEASHPNSQLHFPFGLTEYSGV